jgi:hypothetical protein
LLDYSIFADRLKIIYNSPPSNSRLRRPYEIPNLADQGAAAQRSLAVGRRIARPGNDPEKTQLLDEADWLLELTS